MSGFLGGEILYIYDIFSICIYTCAFSTCSGYTLPLAFQRREGKGSQALGKSTHRESYFMLPYNMRLPSNPFFHHTESQQ